jgi:signal transduction histidine kinase
MPLDVPNDCRSSFSCRRKKRSVTSPSVQDFIAGLRDEKSDQHDSRNAAMGVALLKFAHEFANELSFVSGAMQFLENDIERPHQARNALQHVKSGIQRLDSLLNELRTLAQPQRLSLQPTQLASVIKELLAVEEPRYAASRIRVETDLLPNLPPILLDASKFRQALVNLCRNAVDAMPHGGSLTLRGYLTHSTCIWKLLTRARGFLPAWMYLHCLRRQNRRAWGSGCRSCARLFPAMGEPSATPANREPERHFV